MRRTGVLLDLAAAVVVIACRRHDAQYQAHASPLRPVGLGAMHEVDIVQRDLSRFEHDISRKTEVYLVVIDDLRQRVVVAMLEMVRVEAPVAMRAGNILHTTLFGRRTIQRNPHGQGFERLDRVIIAILMPGRGLADAGRFAEYRHSPEDEIGTDQLFDHVENFRNTRELEPFRVAPDSVSAAGVEVRAENEIGGKIGLITIVAQELAVEPVDSSQGGFGYPVVGRNDQAVTMIGFDFRLAERHRASILQCNGRVQSGQAFRDIFYGDMEQQIIQITSAPIGVGQERACYRHPQHPTRVIKVQKGESDKQTRRELRLYRWLQRRGMDNFAHIPRFYGEVQTNLGDGFVVDLIEDFDGGRSLSLYDCFERGYPLAEFQPYLEELRSYLLENRVIFSVDMGRFNVLFRRLSEHDARLYVIDGLGNHSALNWLDNVPYFARRKIRRRWTRFIGRLKNYSAEMMAAREAEPRELDLVYRRTG